MLDCPLCGRCGPDGAGETGVREKWSWFNVECVDSVLEGFVAEIYVYIWGLYGLCIAYSES